MMINTISDHRCPDLFFPLVDKVIKPWKIFLWLVHWTWGFNQFENLFAESYGMLESMLCWEQVVLNCSRGSKKVENTGIMWAT